MLEDDMNMSGHNEKNMETLCHANCPGLLLRFPLEDVIYVEQGSKLFSNRGFDDLLVSEICEVIVKNCVVYRGI